MDQNQPQLNETDEQRDIRLNKDAAAFSYVWIMSVAIYASKRDSKFAQYHSKQGMILFVLSIIAAIIPWVGKYLLVVVVAGMLLGFINAAQGRYSDVPIVGDLSKGKLSVTELFRMIGTGLRKLYDAAVGAFKKKTASPEPQTAAPKTEQTPLPPTTN
jgi:uncharacterized membrane protein